MEGDAWLLLLAGGLGWLAGAGTFAWGWVARAKADRKAEQVKFGLVMNLADDVRAMALHSLSCAQQCFSSAAAASRASEAETPESPKNPPAFSKD